MTKTTWAITDNVKGTTTEFTLYHFGKAPLFPAWYFEEGHDYTVEMLWNFKLVPTAKAFFKCLTHFYIIK